MAWWLEVLVDVLEKSKKETLGTFVEDLLF